MPTVRMIYDTDGWAYHHQVVALRKHAPADFEITFGRLPGGAATDAAMTTAAEDALGDSPADIVFLMTAIRIGPVRDVLNRRGWRPLLVPEWTDGAPRRLDVFRQLYPLADAWIINNQAYWDAIGRLPRTHMIANGVDRDVFRITRPPAQRRAKVLWTGSQLHRSLKGYDDFILPLRERLIGAGIEVDLHLVDSYGNDKRTPQQMAEWYNEGMVLVCASETEGTPNPALEAAACGCTVVSTPVGNMPQLIRDGVNGYLVKRDLEALSAATIEACAQYLRLSAAMQQTIRDWNWVDRSREFFALFRTLLASTIGGRRSADNL